MTWTRVGQALPPMARVAARATDPALLARLRAGWRPTKVELIATIDSLEELDGYESALRASGRAREPGEAEALALRRRALTGRAA